MVRHLAVCVHASRNTHAPMSMMSPLSSASGMNRSGRDETAYRVMPPQECLGLHDASGAEIEDRLEVEDELVLRQRVPQVALQIEAVHRVGVHLGVEELVPSLAPPLRQVHRQVGIAKQCVDIGLVTEAAGNADAAHRRDRSEVRRRSAQRACRGCVRATEMTSSCP